jgi:acid stress chaperone HdeB
MMKYRNGVLAGLALAALAASAGHAQVTIDIAKITCGQFLTYSVADPREIGLWINGYYTGKRGGGTMIDTQELKAHYDRLRTYCLVNQDIPVMQAVETLHAGDK